MPSAKHPPKEKRNRGDKAPDVQKAIELRIAGYTLPYIAEHAGYSNPNNAARAIRNKLEIHKVDDAELVAELRRVDLERLEQITSAIWAKATAGDLKSIDRVVRIMERRAALMGLDAPKRNEISGPGGAPIEVDARQALIGRITQLVERAETQEDPVIP